LALLLKIFPDRFEFKVNHALRHREIVLRGKLIEQLALQPRAGHAAVVTRELVADRLLEALEIVEPHLLGEGIVDRSRYRLVDLLDLDREGRGLSGQILAAVGLREGDVDRPLLAGLGADKLVLEARDELSGAQLQAIVLGRAALEFLAVDRS